MSSRWTAFTTLAALLGCQSPEVTPLDSPGESSFQAVSFLGDTLRARPSEEAQAVQGPLLEEAIAELERDSSSVEAWIWVGRRQGYLQDYRASIRTYTAAAQRFPDEPKLYRHRGHRFLSVRDVDAAIADFNRAAELIEGKADEVEPDGLPNARGIPTSTLHFNVWYHLGLAHFIKGDFEQAALAYEQCLGVSANPDALVATSYWMYMTKVLLDRPADAVALLSPIDDQLDIIENDGYRDLLLLFKGDRTVDEIVPDGPQSLAQATTLYGVANWHRFEGREGEASRILERLLSLEAQWSSFGYIAAEADAARGRGLGGSP